MEYYEILKALRIDKDLSQADVAKALGTTQQQIYKYENGLQSMTVERLKQLCKLYEVSANYVLNLPEKGSKDLRML